MKLSALTFVGLMAISGIASAKISQLGGEIKQVNLKELTVSVLEEKSGEVKTIKVTEKSRKKIDHLKEGDAVIIDFKPVSLKD